MTTRRARTLRPRPRAILPRGTRLARGALGVVALHVVDDNYLHPAPGTSAADHLVSGLVPLALIVAAMNCYGRARAGVRASLALAIGLFGITAGTEAAYYTANGAMSGDDVTGWLAGAAGILLVALGGLTLWQTRRRDDPLRRRYIRRSLITVVCVVVATQLFLPLVLAYVFTHTARVHVPSPELGAAPENVAFATTDGLVLHGWFVPSRNGATVIAFPGRAGPQRQARMLVQHGYGVLLFDRRGEGTSEGDPNIFGWGGDRDLLAAAAYLRSRPDVDDSRIGAIGLSVGGEMLIHAAAHSDAFKAIVTEGASGQSLRDTLANTGFSHRVSELPTQFSLTAALTVLTNQTPPPSLRSEVAKIAPTAVFFIFGERGQGGTETGPNRAFYAAAHQPKQIWEVPDGQHIAGVTTRPREYERRVVAFFDHFLLGKQ